ncbi:MAG: alpha/beta fold hydrolase [Roseivirga sp.]|nr:alpha/beta fold hydrolase [Roseivirga sp.]
MSLRIVCLLALVLACGCRQSSDLKKISFTSADGLEVTADLYSTGNQSDPIILLFHQSASSRGEYRQIAPVLQRLGFNCLAVDLRWGKQDFWEKIPNETAQRFGSDKVVDNYEDTDEFRREEVWPRMMASVQDMEASLDWANHAGFKGKTLLWGSSFSAMLQFKLAAEHPARVDGMISFSPGEYNDSDTTMLHNWATQLSQPALVIAGSDTSEYIMTKAVNEALVNEKSMHHQVRKGKHGSSILLDSEENWTPVRQFLHQFKNYEAEDYLGFARAAEVWLDSNAVKDENKWYWSDALDEPDKVTTSYSDGVAGKVAWYLDLFKATNGQVYLDKAMLAGEYLMENLPQKTDSLKGKFWAFSPYGNVGGSGFALTELYKRTGKEQYKEAALSIVEMLEHFADNKQDTISWDLGNDVLGGLSGTGLFLLYTAEQLGSDKAKSMAVQAGETLITRAIKEGDRWSWKRGQNSKYVLPNFSHGPAGIGYFMASLYEATAEDRFLEAALNAVNYLNSIANKREGAYLVPYGFPDPGWRRAYDIGWAHGPAGVARLFIKLHQITGEVSWLERAEACYSGILKSNPLGKPSEGFGSDKFTIDQRFGLAGVAAFYQEMYGYTQDSKYLESAVETLDHILSKSVDQDGLSWPMERFGFMANAGKQTTFSGYFYGTTGFGSILLNQYNLMKGKPLGARFVDSPFH